MTTTSTELALPTDGDSEHWTAQERALVSAAGLVRTEKRGQVSTEYLADRPTVEAFLAHCRRTGLDPIARQIYAIYRGGKWGIQISIDGARLVAERTGTYEGQTPVEWTADGVTWTQVWLSDAYPRAARVGVYRRGFREPLMAVATWDSYAVMKDEWAGGQKTGAQVVSDMWKKFGPLMLGKCAEMLALRKAFPQDLSGLYSTEEMAQADKGETPAEGAPAAAVQPVVLAAPVVVEDRDLKAEIAATKTLADLTVLANETQTAGLWGVQIDGPDGEKEELGKALFRRRHELTPPTVVDVPEGKSKPRQWVREARAMKKSEDVRALWREAQAADAEASVLDELSQIESSLPAPKTEAAEHPEGWAPVEPVAEPGDFVEVAPGVYAEQGTPAVLAGDEDD